MAAEQEVLAEVVAVAPGVETAAPKVKAAKAATMDMPEERAEPVRPDRAAESARQVLAATQVQIPAALLLHWSAAEAAPAVRVVGLAAAAAAGPAAVVVARAAVAKAVEAARDMDLHPHPAEVPVGVAGMAVRVDREATGVSVLPVVQVASVVPVAAHLKFRRPERSPSAGI